MNIGVEFLDIICQIVAWETQAAHDSGRPYSVLPPFGWRVVEG